MMKNPFQTHVLSFSQRLFFSVIALFIAFVICFMAFQYRREKDYKVELLNTQLQNYNDQLSDFLFIQDSLETTTLGQYVRSHHLNDLRVTLITPNGKVIFDNLRKNPEQFSNHLDRQEIKQALQQGSGYAIHRQSESVGGEFFYSARYYPELEIIIRSALPYNVSLIQSLSTDSHYIWFAMVISIILIGMFYSFTHKLGMSITHLQQFALKADRNEPIDPDIQKSFPKNELGEISTYIIQIYHRLHRTKEALYIEREKLITHLQISHEGLGVFTKDKKEILVNLLFKQYINFISDKNLSQMQEIFSVPELAPITRFIAENQGKNSKEVRRTSMDIEKDGRIFALECIIFQDNSFEISINDVTQETEQARLKKQLTQNIAHELKTPVSSIQGYLETIVNNPELPREKIDAFLMRSYAQSNRLTHLLSDISLLTRMEEAPNMTEKESVNLPMLAQSIINEVSLQLEEKQIEVQNFLPEDLYIKGNPSLLYSIFRNLTDNAIAYGGTGISITIRCFRQGEKFYYFSFADTGVGVSPEHLGRLFERFYRVDKGRSRKLGGTGLGLAIVKNAVLLHGGSIFAKNNPGGGLEFIFTLSKE
ncbi:MAG: two-component sensor histidine kinase [Bacteroidaceae bacterium]|nr:two-component sensor histidine kinase [Bacteroidaceae bacterium]